MDKSKLIIFTTTTLTTILIMAICSNSFTNANPIDLLDAISKMDVDSDKYLYKMAADYLSEIDLDEEASSAAVLSTHPQQHQGQNVVEYRGEQCKLPVRKGNCRALLPRWRYDPALKSCTEFKFGGCDGNANNFKNFKQCMDTCQGI